MKGAVSAQKPNTWELLEVSKENNYVLSVEQVSFIHPSKSISIIFTKSIVNKTALVTRPARADGDLNLEENDPGKTRHQHFVTADEVPNQSF